MNGRFILIGCMACAGSVDATDPVPSPSVDPTAAETLAGPVVGTEVASGVVAFLGVPYAAPPTGERRFRPPEPPAGWDGPRLADRFADACIQMDRETDAVVGSEDCLYLNVWRPEKPAPEGGFPVLVFVHGGGNAFGSAAEETSPGSKIYDGSSLAANDEVVVVTIQYRLNALGYLASPALDADMPSGNYGLRDQVASLAWVQDNIEAFGGDRRRVLLFGESGGAASVCGILATPAAEGLFHAASIMSGGCGGRPRESLLAVGEAATEAVGCDGAADIAACLRTVDAEALVRAVARPPTMGGFANAWAGPTIDGTYLPESPFEAIVAGRHHAVPLLIGTTADETGSPLFGIRFGLTEDQYRDTVRAVFAADPEGVLERYPPSNYRTPRDALVAVTTDVQFTCPVQRVAAAAEGWGPVYHYVYDHVYDGAAASAIHPRIFGAAHGFELALLFETLPTYDDYEPSEAEVELGRAMAQIWANFAENTVPPGEWPEYDGRYSRRLATGLGGIDGHRAEACEFWADYGR